MKKFTYMFLMLGILTVSTSYADSIMIVGKPDPFAVAVPRNPPDCIKNQHENYQKFMQCWLKFNCANKDFAGQQGLCLPVCSGHMGCRGHLNKIIEVKPGVCYFNNSGVCDPKETAFP